MGGLVEDVSFGSFSLRQRKMNVNKHFSHG